MLRYTDFNRVILCLLKVIINLSFYCCTSVFKILNVFCKFIRIAFDSSVSFWQIWNLEGETWLFSIDGVRSTVLEQHMHLQKPGRVIQRPSNKPSLGTGSHRSEHDFQHHFGRPLRELRWMVDAPFGGLSYDVTEILYFYHIWKRVLLSLSLHIYLFISFVYTCTSIGLWPPLICFDYKVKMALSIW